VNTELLKARQTKYVAYVTLYIVVTLAVVTVANVLANRYDKSYDATANKRYSLSDQTIKVVKGLKQDATITYFAQDSQFSAAKDKLDMYANLSPKVHVVYIDPDKKPLVAQQAGFKNLNTAIVQIGGNKNEAKSNSEEDITGAMIRDLKNTTRTVCFVSGSGEHRIDDPQRGGYSRFKDLLAKDSYEAKTISLLEKPEVSSDCTVLVLGGPTADYQQPEVDAIKKYVEDGGRALILLDPPLKFGRPVVADNDALNAVLTDWGVTAEKDVILDPVGQAVGLGPQVVLVTGYDSHAIVNEMKGTATVFPLSRSLVLKDGPKSTVEKLFESSKSSVAGTKLDSPEVDPRDPKNKQGPMTIAVAGSYRTGKDNSQGRFVVIGSSYWATNSFVTQIGNPDFALNTINWLSSDEDLISIRPKEAEDRKLTMNKSQVNWVGFTSLLLIPLLVVGTGLSVWWRRR
jgi:gliding motility-associatede transport system auxiliary component